MVSLLPQDAVSTDRPNLGPLSLKNRLASGCRLQSRLPDLAGHLVKE
jgi:hypothetical protein